MSRTAIPFLLALALLAAVPAAPTPAQADLIGDALALFETEQEDISEDPYIPVHDAFLTKAQTMEAEGDLPKALEFYKISASAMPRQRDTARQAIALKKRLDSMAQDLYASATTRYEAGDKEAAHNLLLKTLRYNPGHAEAVEFLRTKFDEPIYENYEVASGDTLESIAGKVYDNPGAEFLITKINNVSLATTLNAGDILLMPKVAPALSKPIKIEIAEVAPAKPASSAAPAAPGETAPVPVEGTAPAEAQAPPAEDTAALVSMAKMQFNQRLYDTVVSLTDEILAYEPDNTDALAMRRESYYQLAHQLSQQENDLQALKLLLRIPESYKETSRRVGELKGKLDKVAEPHYLAGVNYFINENLDKAVEEWETALQINPYHAKAKSDLAKAKQLMETVRQLQ